MLRSVDIKQILVQSNSMERVQQTQQQHPEMQQRYLDIQLSEEKKLLKENVRSAESAEEKRVTDRKEREGSHRDAGEREHPRKGTPDPDAEDTGQGGHVDIRV
jgi:hypothetical protein